MIRLVRALFGENPSPLRIVVILLFYAGAVSICYYIFAVPHFSMNEDVMKAGAIASAPLGWFMLYKLIRTAHKNPVLQKYSPLVRGALYLFGIIFYPFLVYIAFFAGPSAAYTRYFGAAFHDTLPYEKTVDLKQSKCGYKVRNSSNTMKELCLSAEIYPTMPDTGNIRIYGHESLLGRTIETYSVPTTAPLEEERPN